MQEIFTSLTAWYSGKVGQVRWQELLTAQGRSVPAMLSYLQEPMPIWIMWLSMPCNVIILAGTDTIMQ